MNVFGVKVLEALLTGPLTLEELMDVTGFQARYVLEGIRQCREDRIVFARLNPGERATYELEVHDDHTPS